MASFKAANNKIMYNMKLQYCTSERLDKAQTVWPWNVLIGFSAASLQTWMHLSVEHEANVLLLCQSTSKAGAIHRDTQTDI